MLRRPRVANFADIIKIATIFIKTTFKDSEYSKSCWFPMKNDVRGVSRNLYVFLDLL